MLRFFVESCDAAPEWPRVSGGRNYVLAIRNYLQSASRFSNLHYLQNDYPNATKFATKLRCQWR